MVKLQRFLSVSLIPIMLGGCSGISESITNLFENENNKEKAKELSLTSVKAAAEAEESKESNAEKGLSKHLVEKAADAASLWIEGMAPGTEVTIKTQENGKPEYAISTIQEIDRVDKSNRTIFWQGQMSNHDGGDRTTLNAGFGYRHLVKNETVLLGANAFIDHELPYDHQRASFGLEMKSAPADININKYKALSDWKNGASGNQERALDGQEIELAAQLPYIPSARIFLKSFKWENIDSASDIEGKSYSMELKHPFGAGWILEAGKKNFDNRPDENFAFVKYSVGFATQLNQGSSVHFVSQNMFETGSIKNRKLEKVRRSNRIVKQTGGFQVSFR